MEDKLYEIIFQARHGEHTFDFLHLYKAKNDEDANKLAHKWCCDFYGGVSEKLDENSYEFQGGCIILTIKTVREVDKEKWKEEQFEKSLIRNI